MGVFVAQGVHPIIAAYQRPWGDHHNSVVFTESHGAGDGNIVKSSWGNFGKGFSVGVELNQDFPFWVVIKNFS